MRLFSYSQYKKVDVPWIKNIPSHWKIQRGKHLFTKMDRPVSESDEVVTCFRDGVVTLRKNRRVRGFTESLKEIGYQGIKKGDLVIHAMDAFAGAVGVSDSNGKGTPVYSVCEPKHGVNSHYYALIVREMARNKWILAIAKGIRERSTDFRFSEFGDQYLPLPPLDEQNAIVRFLDYTDRRIKRYIRAKQKLIKLLEEEKQAIIHQAVTRGLNPDVPMKPSEVEWLGDIPRHWIICPLKRLVSINRNTLTEQTNKDLEINYIEIGSVGTGELNQTPLLMRFQNSPSRARRILNYGDTIISTVRTYLKAIWYVNIDTPNLIASTGFAVLTPSKKIEPEFLSIIIQSKYFIDKVTSNSTGTAYPAISETALSSIKIVFPSEIREQQNILMFVKSKNNKINEQIKNFQEEISHLQEYRTRLIADVVTGKLDVREAAAQLPEELEAEEIDIEETEVEDEEEQQEELEL